MNSFADGLQLGRLQPPSIIAFLQGLPRRVDQRLVAVAASTTDKTEHAEPGTTTPSADTEQGGNTEQGGTTTPSANIEQGGNTEQGGTTTPTVNIEQGGNTEQALRAMHDSLARAAVALKESGFAPDHDLESKAQPIVRADPELSRLHGATLEVARRVAGVPDSGWIQHPELLDLVRQACAEAAEQLDVITKNLDAP